MGAFGIFDDLVSAASWGEDLRAGGLGQPIWAAGAAGAGTAAPGGYLARYLRCYAQWRATSLLSDLMEVPDESGSLTVMIEALSARLLPSRASFWWASRELAQLIARHTPNGVLPQQAVNELADYVDTTAQQAHWWDGNCGAVPSHRPRVPLPNCARIRVDRKPKSRSTTSWSNAISRCTRSSTSTG